MTTTCPASDTAADRALMLLLQITMDRRLRRHFRANGYTTADHVKGYALCHNVVIATLEARSHAIDGLAEAEIAIEKWTNRALRHATLVLADDYPEAHRL